MKKWNAKLQEKHLTINAKVSIAVGLFFLYESLYSAFDLTFNLFNLSIGMILLVILFIWAIKGIFSLKLQPQLTSRYSDEYIKHLYQQSLVYAFYGYTAVLMVFFLANETLASYFSMEYTAKFTLAIGFLIQGIYIQWRLYQDAKEDLSEEGCI